MNFQLVIRYCVIAVVMLFFYSCAITVNGLTDDYETLTKEQKELILPFDSLNKLKNGFVYMINAEQLKIELSKYKKSIVYCFTNGCTSSYCEPISTYIDYAKENGYKLFLVMNGFRDIQSTLDQFAPTPYFVINSKYYNTKYRSKYTRRFENELLNRDKNYKDKKYYGNLYFFKGSHLVEIKRHLYK